MGMMQTIRCKAGHHEWGPYVGPIGETRHECQHCATVKPVKAAKPPRRDPGGSGMTGPGGSGSGADGAGFDSGP
jgi:hypothetical protein